MIGLRSATRLLLIAAVSTALGCEEVRNPANPIEVDATANVVGVLFLDLNGNGRIDATDSPVRNWTVTLVGPNGSTVAESLSDSAGVFRLLKVPAGQARLELDSKRLADTLQVFGLALGQTYTLARGDSVAVSIGFTYPKIDLAGVDTLPTGRRVFTEGIALNTILPNGPRELHLRAGSKAVRITNIVRRQISAGDSVRALARRATEAGVPILTDGDFFTLRAAVEDPLPLPITTGRAATADGGAVSAQLVRIRNADLISAANVDNDVVLTADDGTGPVQILVRAFLGADASFFKPDSMRVQEATGLLVPYRTAAGQTGWRVALRVGTDLKQEAEKKPAPSSAQTGAGDLPASNPAALSSNPRPDSPAGTFTRGSTAMAASAERPLPTDATPPSTR